MQHPESKRPEHKREDVHEMRNLLNSIGSCAYLISQREDLDEVRTLAMRIRERSDAAAELLGQLFPDRPAGAAPTDPAD